MVTDNGQAGKIENFHQVDICCQQIASACGKPDIDKWTNRDYVDLSQELFQKSRVRISPNTLKRIFGKIRTDARYYPQKATRDALAIYLGHPDWEHFVRTMAWQERYVDTEPKLTEPVALPTPVEPRPVRPNVKSLRWIWLVLLGVSIGIGALVWLRGHPDGESARLICRNPLGENPHSAVFDIHRPDADRSATYALVFGDGRRELIGPDDSLHTHYYERPGRFFAMLQRNGVNVDTAVVYLQTRDWTVTASMPHDTTRVYPVELSRPVGRSEWRVSANEAFRAGVDTNRTFFVEFINSHPTRINGDNFELTATVKTSPDRAGVRCSQVGITVWGESVQHTFEVMKPGCAHWVNLQTGDILKSGSHDDLSFLGADLRAGGTLRLRVIDKRARVFIGDRLVYDGQYQTPLNRIYGVRIRFSGIGTIQSFALRDLKTNRPFDGNF